MKNIISVSVIIPCYKCNNTIKRAIDSVLNQTVLPKEIFIWVFEIDLLFWISWFIRIFIDASEYNKKFF